MKNRFQRYTAIAISPFKAIASLLLCTAILPAGLFPWDGQQPFVSQRTPILLIHGYLYNKAGWLYLRHRLMKEGLEPVFTMNLGSPLHSIEEYSQRVKEKAKEIAQLTGRSDLILIGHSMGGIISSYYAVHDAAPGTVTDVITLGSPLKGTKYKINIGKCTLQMRLDCDFLKQLHADVSSSPQTRFFCIGSQSDWIIVPQESALYSHPEAKKLVIPDMGHLQYLFSNRVANAIIEYLTFETRDSFH